MKRVSAAVTALALLAAVSDAAAKEPVTFTDVAGRQVTVNVPVETMILGEGRFLPTLGILDRDDPTRRVAAMMGEFQKYDPATYAQYVRAFPAIESIPAVGAGSAESFSTERAITASADVAVFALGSGHGPGARHKHILEILEAAGIPVVIIDFRIEPLVNTPTSIDILGRLMGREAEAAEFLAFYRAGLKRVRDALDGVSSKPRVFMELRAGFREQCCAAAGAAMLGRFIAWAGGDNIMAEAIPGTHGVASLEHLLTAQPDIYVSTAIGNHGRTPPDSMRVILGSGAPAEVAAETLRRSLSRPGLNALEAVRDGKAYSIWHHFYNTPMNVVAVQALAKWFHPERLADVDPRETLAEYFRRFQPVALDGVYWTGTRP